MCWHRVATGQSFDRNQISVGFDDNGFFKIIAGRAWIRLVACCGSRDVGQRVSALANVNGSRKSQCRRSTGVERSDVEHSGGVVKGALRDRA